MKETNSLTAGDNSKQPSLLGGLNRKKTWNNNFSNALGNIVKKAAKSRQRLNLVKEIKISVKKGEATLTGDSNTEIDLSLE